MPLNDEVKVYLAEDKRLRCITCESEIQPDSIALLLRHKRGGVFDPLCVECTFEIIRKAGIGLEVQQIETILFN